MILNILKEFLKEMEKYNPYRLIAKGGTALSIFYLNCHRESEDLDFDATIDKENYKKIESYLLNLLNKLKKRGLIKDYFKGKSGLASTNRYHMKLKIETHNTDYTKIDVDFIKDVKNPNKKGELLIHNLERIFIGKCIAFTDRKEFKDIYDIYYILPKLNISTFKGNKNVIRMMDSLIENINNEDIIIIYKKAFRNVDLRFKDLKESNIENFISKLVKNLKTFKNKIEF
jgi:predicted nucleotidyltransferase component of viral defense system